MRHSSIPAASSYKSTEFKVLTSTKKLNSMELFTALQSSYSEEKVTKWFEKNVLLGPVLCVLYLMAVFLGRKWMHSRRPYSLRRELATWNAGLAIFSFVAFVKVTPFLLEKLSEEGFSSSVCSHAKDRQTILWITIITLSKVVEFGDTIFIVLRKSPLIFLHWYHHATVCFYGWYGASINITDSPGHWFGWMNCGVHSVMYTYYSIRAAGYRLPTAVSKCITILQLLQFIVGLICIMVAWWSLWNGLPCNTSRIINQLGLLLYLSFLVLFLNFFYNRYVK